MWLEKDYFNICHHWGRCFLCKVHYGIYHVIGYCGWITPCFTCNNKTPK